MRTTCAIALLCLTSGLVSAQFKPSVKQQIDLGKQAAADIRKKEKVLPDTDLRVKIIRAIGQKLVQKIPADELKKKPWEFTFDVVESTEVNAFALPGGPVFFFSGLIDKLKTEDEIAGVIGHELMHVREEHWANQYNDTMKRKVGLSIILGIMKASDVVANATDIAADIAVGLRYSRKSEGRADSGGYKNVSDGGFNPQGMIDVFKMLNQMSGNKPPEFMSSHPDDKRRISALETMLRKDPKKYPALVKLPADLPKTPQPVKKSA